ncbi:MAG: 23S rRNA (adenine(2503)-C(2))-methyltransferase RlmN [Pirellulaceae bacterium]|jgi:23S rRNA (adenine2503-C2)-methyltransferase|nr:23S rRNA (adenine(2503)-C(2))-methyltransferase RlmN [Pirellulaceae bacterium]HJN08256.1 23S rRNA (adenine(2503)-C(2))-methyltransferase RlmN [Pirellulaceae bacterium]
MKNLLETTADELSQWFAARGHRPYRAGQIRNWLFNRRATSFNEMTDVSQGLRDELAASFAFGTAKIVTHHKAVDGTEKLLLEFSGGQIECVLLRDGIRRSICISSQVGCAMGCVFCASGLDGVERNLSTAEIVEQMLQLARLLPADERLSHIVVMGMGEPLANLDNVLAALAQATDREGLGISPRRMTISTVGLPVAMKRLTAEDPRFNLAVSLHAPNDELRNELVPVNDKTGLDAIIAAADQYFDASGRRLTFEYVLLGGLNDDPDHARQLACLLRGRPALLNVIPYNTVPGLPYRTPSDRAQREFRQILQDGGLNVHFRQRKGDEIDAACGQLRRIKPTVVQTD